MQYPAVLPRALSAVTRFVCLGSALSLVGGCDSVGDGPGEDAGRPPIVDAPFFPPTDGAAYVACGTGGEGTAAPSADAGPPQSLTLPDTHFVLSGSVTGRACWSQIEGPSTAILDDAGSPTARGIVLVPGTYRFELVATNAAGDQASSRVEVTLAPAPTVPGPGSRPSEWVRAEPRPIYRAGHTMLPNAVSIEASMPLGEALAEFGFGLSIGLNAGYPVTSRADEAGHVADVMNAVRGAEGRYQLILGYGNMLPGSGRPAGTWVTEGDLLGNPVPEEVWVHDRTGARTSPPIMSPEAPESFIRAQGRSIAPTAAYLSSEYPVSLVLSGGEYGLSVLDVAATRYLDDPVVMAAAAPFIPADAMTDTDRIWWLQAYSSLRYQQQQSYLVDEIMRDITFARGVPSYGLYGDSYGLNRGRWNGYLFFGSRFEDGRATMPPVSTLAQPEYYFSVITNSGFTGLYEYAGPSDIAMHLLNDVAGNVAIGSPHFYGWLSAGWSPGAIAERERWMGFTKLLFACGMLGGWSGYFDYSDSTYVDGHVRDAALGGGEMPSWLWQMVDLGQAQALFSHFEDFLREGDLVAGSLPHPYTADVFDVFDGAPKPLYALTEVGYTIDQQPTAYVVARKLRGADEWLVTAWANSGPDRDVTVEVPELGELTFRARVAGSVYRVSRGTSGPVSVLIDVDPMHPTAFLFP